MSKIFWLSMVLAFSHAAPAAQFIKCNSRDGKTLWGSFGKRMSSAGTTLFATELVVFKADKELQARLLFRTSREAIEQAPIRVQGAQFFISFLGRETIALRPYNPQMPTAFTGIWAVQEPTGMTSSPVACDIY
ncbi:MAG TPA: hypothetical protein PKC28_13545 [Bdellovibrionales bacterium]|nr:hypothetical protein [Bdellovibrionales bacterium]